MSGYNVSYELQDKSYWHRKDKYGAIAEWTDDDDECGMNDDVSAAWFKWTQLVVSVCIVLQRDLQWRSFTYRVLAFAFAYWSIVVLSFFRRTRLQYGEGGVICAPNTYNNLKGRVMDAVFIATNVLLGRLSCVTHL